MANDIITLPDADIKATFSDGGSTTILDRIEAEARAIIPDTTTPVGRKAIASNAAKVARSKTYLDGLGKSLTADLKKRTSAVDAERRRIRTRLDALKEEVRYPLTKYENEQKERVRMFEERIRSIEVAVPRNRAALEKRLAEIDGIEIDDMWEEFRERGSQARALAIAHCKLALFEIESEERLIEARRIAEEDARIEAEKIAEKQRVEAQAQAKAQAKAQAEERRAQAEEHERRIRMEERASAAKRQEEAIRREKQAADDAIKAAIDAEKAARALEAAKALEATREEEKQRARKEMRDEAVAKNKRHRAAINRSIIASIVALVVDIDEEIAKKIVVSVADGAIPGMRIDY